MTAEVLFEDPAAWPGMGYVPNADGSVRDVDPDEQAVDIERDILPFEAITAARTTVVAAVNGVCMAGGMLLALAADITIASDRASFRVPELLRGVPDPWMPVMLPAHVGLERAKYLMLTAERFDAQQAAAWGLISAVVDHAELPKRTETIVDAVLQGAPIARGIYKAQANRYLVAVEPGVTASASEEEKLEGFRAFAEKRLAVLDPPRASVGDAISR